MPYKDPEKRRENARKYYENDYVKNKSIEYYKANKEKKKKYKKKYYIDNKDSIRSANKKWREKNKDKIKIKNHEYYIKNKDVIQYKKKKYLSENRYKVSKQRADSRILNIVSITKKSKEYYEKNKDYINKKEYARVKKFREDNPEEYRRKMSLARKKSRDCISDSYVTKIICVHSSINVSDIPQELIELKRAQIKLQRKLNKCPLK